MRKPSAIARAALALLLSALALSAATASAAAPASARTAPVQAFVLTSSPDSLQDLKAHARAIDVAYPTYFNCQLASGELTGSDQPAIDAYAHARHIRLMPRFNCQDGATVHDILTDPQLRGETLARLATLARNPLYSGLCLDLENDGAADREALTSFVAEAARSLHVRHKKLAVVVDGVQAENASISTGFYDDRALGTLADTVFVLAWGTHWERSAPGPIAPLSYVAAVARYVASLPSASHFVLGAAMYGLDWAGEGGAGEQASAYQYSQAVALARSVGAVPARDRESGEMTFSYTSADGVVHHVWYMDARSVLDVVRIAHANHLTVGLWRLGREDQALWGAGGVGA
jgi:spore germination protein YaaH